jgi:PIN domain nuclease of toxin-antitoxin system
MRLLLDTHFLLWAAAGTLTETASYYIEDKSNTLLFSPASIWEVVIKRALGRADFDVDPAMLYRGLVDAGYEELPITGGHALLVGSLPQLHKDPFDRILLAQSAAEHVPLLTADKTMTQYPGSIIFLGTCN